jgi:hypothetical protein
MACDYSDHVAGKPGRRVLIGHISQAVASMSFPRHLTLSKVYEPLQQFLPQLSILRRPSSAHTTWSAHSYGTRSPLQDYTRIIDI